VQHKLHSNSSSGSSRLTNTSFLPHSSSSSDKGSTCAALGRPQHLLPLLPVALLVLVHSGWLGAQPLLALVREIG
jgi:hypothetical protein